MGTTTVGEQDEKDKRRQRRGLRRQRVALQAECRAAGITHDQIAVRCDVHRTTVVQWFSGYHSSKAVPLAIELLLRERREAKAS